jgi:hypothetical protein
MHSAASQDAEIFMLREPNCIGNQGKRGDVRSRQTLCWHKMRGDSTASGCLQHAEIPAGSAAAQDTHMAESVFSVLTTLGSSGSMHSADSKDAEIFILREPSCYMTRRIKRKENRVTAGEQCMRHIFSTFCWIAGC